MAMPDSTSDPRAWRPGMIFISPTTGKRSTNPADVPGTAQYQERQNAALAGRYTGGNSPVATAPPTASAARAPSTTSYGRTASASGGGGGAAAAQRSAQAAANTAARSGANSAKTQLQMQIDAALAQRSTNQAKLDALGKLVGGGLQAGLDTGLRGVDRDLKTLIDQAFENYNTGLSDLNAGLRDNEKSESDSSFGNVANRGRETQDLVAQALSQGAGESDVLKTQLQALRNWSSNQGEINRSYFDTLTSTNNSINDLAIGTKSNMTNYEMEANQRKQGLYGDYYTGLADAYTQMDNAATNNYLLDQEIAANQAQVGGQDQLLAWLAAGKSADSFTMPAIGAPARGAYSSPYAQLAAENAGKVWENPGVSEATKQWEGQETVVSQLNSSTLFGAPTNTALGSKKPEGATQRKW